MSLVIAWEVTSPDIFILFTAEKVKEGIKKKEIINRKTNFLLFTQTPPFL